jgi:ribose transport system permease protein
VNIKVMGIGLLLMGLWAYMAITVPESFLDGGTISNLLLRTAMYGVLGIGVAFVIITAGIDLSIGSVVCLSGCLLTILLKVDYEPFSPSKVLEVDPVAQTIVIEGSISDFQVGDSFRFDKSPQVRGAVVELNSTKQIQFFSADDEQEYSATLLTVSGLKGEKQDERGEVAKLFPVSGIFIDLDAERKLHEQVREKYDTDRDGLLDEYEVEEVTEEDKGRIKAARPAIFITGKHEISTRDKIAFFSSKGSMEELVIAHSEVVGNDTKVQFKLANPDSLNEEWMIPPTRTIGVVGDGWSALPKERNQRMPVPFALLTVLVFALLLGLLHGLLITKIKLQPFVVTLCGLLMYRGISRWSVKFSAGEPDMDAGLKNEYESSLSPLTEGKLILWSVEGASPYAIPYAFLIFVAVAILAAVFLNRTIWGRYMLALGRNVEAARFSGINTDKMVMVGYVICTAMAALGGVFFLVYANTISPAKHGNFFELYAIAAAVLGGCSLRGGEGSILGVVIGTALMVTLKMLITLKKIPDALEFVILGAVILAGVIADEMLKRAVARKRAIQG